MAGKKQLLTAEVAGFCRQLSLILKTGIPFREGLDIIGEDAGNEKTKEIITFLTASVEEGRSLSEALADSGRFPKYMVDMAAVGEASGRLDEVTAALADYYEWNRAIERSIKSAVLYPAVMALMMLVVLIVLVVKVLPIFYEVFRDMGGEMSPFATGLMHIGVAISQNAVVITAIVAAFLVALVFSLVTTRGRGFWSRMGAKGFSKIHREITAGKFASSMALMMKSGMDIDESLDMTAKVVGDNVMKERIANARAMMDRGDGFPTAIMNSGIFSGLHGAMIALGAKTGTTDQVMESIANDHEEEAERRMTSLISAIEPAIVAVLSILVGLILLSVILPLMGVMSSL